MAARIAIPWQLRHRARGRRPIWRVAWTRLPRISPPGVWMPPPRSIGRSSARRQATCGRGFRSLWSTCIRDAFHARGGGWRSSSASHRTWWARNTTWVRWASSLATGRGLPRPMRGPWRFARTRWRRGRRSRPSWRSWAALRRPSTSTANWPAFPRSAGRPWRGSPCWTRVR